MFVKKDNMLHYQSKGTSAKQIIFVHGNSQSSETWDSIINNETLTKIYKLIAVDLPGHGKSFRSKEPIKDYSVFGLSEALKEFILELNSEEYILVGNSLGANLIGEIAKELVNCKGIMLIGSSAVGTKLALPDIFQPNPNVAACFIAEPSDEQIDLLVGDVGHNLSDKNKREVRTMFENTDGNVRVQLGECIGKAEYSDELGNIESSRIPVAVIFGEEEKLCVIDSLDKISFPKWRNKTHLISKAGHFPQIDQPGALTAIIKEFSSDCFN